MKDEKNHRSILDDDDLWSGFEGHKWLVHKFGGTSVASSECYLTVASILEEQLGFGKDVLEPSNGTRLAIVVSAMGGKPKTTDLLLDSVVHASNRDQASLDEKLGYILNKHAKCLEELFDPDECNRLLNIVKQDILDIRDILKTVSLMKWQAQRISELVSGYGELWSAQILTSVMRKRSTERQIKQKELSSNSLQSVGECHEFVYLDARRVIIVDEEAISNGAIVWKVSQEKLKLVYDEEVAKIDPESNLHFVITGYVASNTEGVATTLQRDGSDYSASIMGRLLLSNSITIWTDVDGILSADPRRVPLSQVLSDISYNEAMELAYFGARVIHPKTMQPAISAERQIPIYIRNTFNATFPGTRIYTASTTHHDSQRVVCGLTSIDDMALVNVEGSGMIGVPGVDRRIFATLEREGINVVLISQGSSEHSVTFATKKEQAMIAKAAIEEEFAREISQNRISNVEVTAPCSIIAAVGDGMAYTTGVSGRFFSALGDAKINVLAIAQGSSERNISAVINSDVSTRALRAIHAAFRLSHTTVRVAIVGMNELGDSLVKLLEQQRQAVRTTFDCDLQVCAILPSSTSTELVTLKKDDDSTSDSISIGSYNEITGGSLMLGATRTSFREDHGIAKASEGNLSTLLDSLVRTECSNHVIFDCTNDEEVGTFHADWLCAGVNVVTANNTGISGPKQQRDEIDHAQKLHGKDSAKYLNEVTVGGGLPIINTLRSLLHSGDKIRRVDGILSVSLSFIMFRISPPRDIDRCSEFDEKSSKGAFRGDLSMSPKSSIGEPCSFSQAVKEAIALGLMEEDPTKDLNNEYSSRVLMVLAMELGLGSKQEFNDIQNASEKLLETILHEQIDYHNLSPDIDIEVKKRVDAARERGCVLRQISSVDVKSKEVEIKLLEVPENHIFAITPPSCECVRFFTHRHRRYPLIIQGPSAGEDSTASAMLAELLQLMRSKASPISVTLSRTGSSASILRTSLSQNGGSEQSL